MNGTTSTSIFSTTNELGRTDIQEAAALASCAVETSTFQICCFHGACSTLLE